MNRRKFLMNGVLAGAGTTGLLGVASAQPSVQSQKPISDASQITLDGVPLETALAGLAQSALPADRMPVSGVVPTVTYTNSQIPNTAFTFWTSPVFRIFAGRMLANQNYPYEGQAGMGVSYITGLYESGAAAIEWMMDGSIAQVLLMARGGHYRLLVDGVAVTPATGTPADGNFGFLQLDFGGVRAIRRITLQTNANFGFVGVYVGPNDTLWQSSRQLGPRCIVMGDSFTEGTGTYFAFDAFPAVFGKAIGLDDTWASGSGGTGYLANDGNSLPYRYTFRQRVATDVIAYKPQIVVIAGGINDSSGPYTPAQIQAEATTLYQQIVASLPHVRLYVLGPWMPPAAQNANNNAVQAALQAAVTAVPGVTFLDVSGYFTGRGNVGSPTGSGNSDLYIGTDHTHPTPAGHLYIGSRLAAAFAATQTY